MMAKLLRASPVILRGVVSALAPLYYRLKFIDDEGTLFTKRPMGVLFAAAIVNLYLAAPALAQTELNQPKSGNVAQDFKTGANHVGNGAVQIGQGIKQGAILTWEAIKAGASATASKFNGDQSASPKN
jgi:hypothetical protein